jgi:uncharacterized membrane protein YedE/YeeE
MTKFRFGFVFLSALTVVCILLAGCETVPDPVLPPQEKAASQSEAEAHYQQYRLSKVGHTIWGAHYLQGMKPHKYSYQHLSHLYALSSLEAQSAYRKGSNRAIVGGVFGGVGGGLFGYPFGWYIATDELGTPEYVMLGVGIVISGISIILTILADDAFEAATTAYNLDLKETLGAE